MAQWLLCLPPVGEKATLQTICEQDLRLSGDGASVRPASDPRHTAGGCKDVFGVHTPSINPCPALCHHRYTLYTGNELTAGLTLHPWPPPKKAKIIVQSQSCWTVPHIYHFTRNLWIHRNWNRERMALISSLHCESDRIPYWLHADQIGPNTCWVTDQFKKTVCGLKVINLQRKRCCMKHRSVWKCSLAYIWWPYRSGLLFHQTLSNHSKLSIYLRQREHKDKDPLCSKSKTVQSKQRSKVGSLADIQ